MSGSSSDDTDAAAAPPAATALVFGFVPVSLDAVWAVAPFDGLVEVAEDSSWRPLSPPQSL